MDSEHPVCWTRDIHTPTRWCCEEDHDEQWFDDEAALKKHIESEHPEYGEGLLLDGFKDMCEVRLPRPAHTCPICNSIPNKLAVILQPDAQGLPTVAVDNEILRDELLRHIAQHLKEVGFMSIHYLEDGDDAESRASTDENKKGLPDGRWEDGEWVPPVPPYLDRDFLDYGSVGDAEFPFPVDWASLIPSATRFLEREPEQILRSRLFLSTGLRGPENPLTRDCWQVLSTWLVGQQRFEDAEEPCRNGLELSEKLDGQYHVQTILLMECLEKVLKGLGRNEEAKDMVMRRLRAQGLWDAWLVWTSSRANLFFRICVASSGRIHRATDLCPFRLPATVERRVRQS